MVTEILRGLDRTPAFRGGTLADLSELDRTLRPQGVPSKSCGDRSVGSRPDRFFRRPRWLDSPY